MALDALPLYVPDGGSRSPDPAPRGRSTAPLRSGLGSVARATIAVADDLARQASEVDRVSTATERARTRAASRDFRRFLLTPAGPTTEAFERWLAAGAPPRLRSALGWLQLGPPLAEPRPGHLVTVPCRLRVPTSVLPLPMELGLLRWGTRRTVLELRLARRVPRRVPWHGRAAYFAVGNAVLDRLRDALEQAATGAAGELVRDPN